MGKVGCYTSTDAKTPVPSLTTCSDCISKAYVWFGSCSTSLKACQFTCPASDPNCCINPSCWDYTNVIECTCFYYSGSLLVPVPQVLTYSECVNQGAVWQQTCVPADWATAIPCNCTDCAKQCAGKTSGKQGCTWTCGSSSCICTYTGKDSAGDSYTGGLQNCPTCTYVDNFGTGAQGTCSIRCTATSVSSEEEEIS